MSDVEKKTKNDGACEDCADFTGVETEACACCARKKERTEKERAAILNRLRRVEGQVRGIEKMIENDAYCTDVITQVSAVAAALNAVNRELISKHIRTCVAEDLRQGKTETADELATVVERLMR